MPFSEKLKKRVRESAAYRCCRCQGIGVEVHHIIPQNEKGPDTWDNAAPLCAKCHGDFGDNPSKRKEIKEMRDWWYKKVLEDYSPYIEIGVLTQKIDSLILETRDSKEKLDEWQASLGKNKDLVKANIEPKSFQDTNGGLVDMLQLDSGYWIRLLDIVYEGYCECERNHCVDHEGKVYCYFGSMLSPWIIKTKLYWKCYDEKITCPRCGNKHKRGHIGREENCKNPYINQENQTD